MLETRDSRWYLGSFIGLVFGFLDQRTRYTRYERGSKQKSNLRRFLIVRTLTDKRSLDEARHGEQLLWTQGSELRRLPDLKDRASSAVGVPHVRRSSWTAATDPDDVARLETRGLGRRHG